MRVLIINKFLYGKVFNSYSSKADLSAWVETLSL